MNPFLETVLSNVVFAAALAVVVAVVTTFWRNRHAAHILWVLVLVKLVTPPVWNVPLAMGDAFEPRQSDEVETERPAPRSTDAAIEPDQVTSTLPLIDASSIVIEPIAPSPPAPQLTEVQPSTTAEMAPIPPRTVTTAAIAAEPVDWSWLLLRAWIATSALWLIVAVVRILKFHRLVRRSPVADAALLSQVKRLSSRLGLRAAPDVCVLDGNISPMVWPLTWKRSLLLPRRLLDELTPSQLETVIAHELAHLVRRDDWIRFLEAAVTCLFWWNPVVWWARRELHQAEEDCCDALVVCALPESRRQYGEALLRAAEIVTFGRSLPALASAFAQQRFLKRRIEMILMHEFRRGLAWPFKVLLLALAVAILPLAATAVSQDDPATTSQQVDSNTTSAQSELPVSPQPGANPTVPQTSGAAANQSAPDGSASARDLVSTIPIIGLPGSDLLMGGFSWQDQHSTTVEVGAEREWTFVDLDTGTSAQLGPYEVRETPLEAQGYDIRLRSWVDDVDGRTQIIAVLLDIAYQEWRDGLDDLTAVDLYSLAQAATRSDAIPPRVGIFRTSEGNLGVLEFTTEDGRGVLKYQLLAMAGDPLAPADAEPVGTTLPGIYTSPRDSLLDPNDPQSVGQPTADPNSVPTDPAGTTPPGIYISPRDSLLDPSVPQSVGQPTANANSVPTDPLQPVAGEPAATVTWPAQPAANFNTVQSISTDAEVQQLELELLVLDEEAASLQLEAEKRKLEYLMRLVQAGEDGAGSVDEQQLKVDLLEIEVARAHIRRQLYQTQIDRQRGAGTEGNQIPQQNVPAEPEPSTSGNLFDSGFLPGTELGPSLESSSNQIQDPANPLLSSSEERQRTLDALRLLNQNSINTPGDPQLERRIEQYVQRRIEQYEEAFRLQSQGGSLVPDAGSNPPPGEARFPRPVRPEGEMAIVRGVIVEQGKPIANKVIWIIGEEDGETVLYQDGPSGDDGTFEFTDVPVGRPWRVFIPSENGPGGFGTTTMILLNEATDTSIEVVVDGETVTAELVADAPSN